MPSQCSKQHTAGAPTEVPMIHAAPVLPPESMFCK